MRNDRGVQPRGRTVGRDRRGQTLQDYAIGIGVFLLAVTFVFTTLGGFLAPFTSGVTAEEKAQADQLADSIVRNYSEGVPNRLDAARLETTLNRSGETIQTWYGISTSVTLNVSVRTLNSSAVVNVGNTPSPSRPLAVDNRVAGRSTASTARIITLPGISGCDPACRLVVQVW